jgi:AraC family transcriptional regulator
METISSPVPVAPRAGASTIAPRGVKPVARAYLRAAYAGLAPHRLHRVLALIEERLAEPIPVHELAASVRMSPYHFARMFKQSTGHPPHHYITWQRMDRAKELLARSSLPLAEIATRVGYRTQSHFTGVFHARVGITPRAYRLRCVSKEIGALPAGGYPPINADERE